MEQTRITKGPYTAKPEPGMVLVANFGLGSFVMAPAGTNPGDQQATAEFFANAANSATKKNASKDEMICAMALWEAVLDARNSDLQKTEKPPLIAQFEGCGFSQMRQDVADLVPATEAAWGRLGLDFAGCWDWQFLPMVVDLWIEADFDASAVTVEKIVAAAMPSKEG